MKFGPFFNLVELFFLIIGELNILFYLFNKIFFNETIQIAIGFDRSLHRDSHLLFYIQLNNIVNFTFYFSGYQSSFSEFAPIFNPYGGMYIPEFTQKPLDGSFHHQQQQPPYENFTNENFTESKENQYTSLNPVTSTNKIESFSELLNGRYGSYPTYEGEFSNLNETSQNGAEKSNENSTNSEEADENFGEIIKKSMVETVSA